jgi:anti-sigma-K factor RskA
VTHEELRDLIPAYALDALEPEAARAVEAHLPGCGECRDELSSFQAVAAELATGVTPVEPPAALRERVLAVAQPRRLAVVPSGLWRAGLAVAAALVLILGGITLVQFQRIRTMAAHMGALSARLAAQERVLVLLASPTSRTATLRGSTQANVRFVYDRATGQGALVVSDLRDPGASVVYQLWLVAGQEPESAGVFRPIPGQPVVIPVNADFRRYQAVAISVEQGPQGSPAGPTTVPILSGTI